MRRPRTFGMIAAITGANGFMGAHVCDRFAAAGYTIQRVTRADYTSNQLLTRLRDADVIVHLAGATRAPTRAALFRSNVDLTHVTVEAAAKARVRRFVFVSSQAAAGPAAFRDVPVHEAMRPSPVEEYGQSKLEAEALVQASDLSYTIVRPAAVYGPGDRDFLALFRLARRGLAMHSANREHWVSIAHVTDVADGIFRAATSDAAVGKVYFLGGEERQWCELFQAAATAAGRQLHVDINVPEFLVDAGARAGDLLARLTHRAGLLSTQKVRLSKPRYWLCSSERARRELGYTNRIALQAGFASTYHWYLDHHWL